jgi:hypothetical protein
MKAETKTQVFRFGATLAIAALTLILPLYLQAAKPQPISAKAHVFDFVIDEHNTNAFYGATAQYCEGTNVQAPDLTGDLQKVGSGLAWGFPGWQQVADLSSLYVDKEDCGPNCLNAQFDANAKIFSFDTRGTQPLRKLTVSLAHPCNDPGCPGPIGNPADLNGSYSGPTLMNISMTDSYRDMAVCSSTACPQAQPGFAKVWFNDPNDASTQWRIDWAYVRILRMSETVWYVISNGCDGTQIAGLSRLTGNRTRPRTVFNGYFKIPFFVGIELK